MGHRVLSLYKQLIRYSNGFIFTDKNFFREYIRKSYKKDLTDQEIEIHIKVIIKERNELEF